MFPNLVYGLDVLGVAVFAASGALVASRKEMDLIGFGLLAAITGIGGGTLRDVILDRPVFWILDQSFLAICLLVALVTFFAAHLIQRRYPVLVWLDAVGLAAYGVLGAHVATQAGAGVVIAAVLGVITATFGGMMRDVVSQEMPLILQKQLYATAALASAVAYLVLTSAGLSATVSAIAATVAGFLLRGAAIRFDLTLPRYKPREGRSY